MPKPGFSKRLTLLVTAALLLISLSAQASSSLDLGVLATQPKPLVEERFRPLSDYLSKALVDTQIKLHILNHDELEIALQRNELDLILTDPSHYLKLRSQSSFTGAIATLISEYKNVTSSSLGGVIITHADSGIKSIKDLRQRRLVTLNNQLLGSQVSQVYELAQAGISFPDDLQVENVATEDEIVRKVLSGDADAGFIRTGVIESMHSADTLDPGTLKIINQQNLVAFPYVVSTRLYPEWPFVALPHVRETTLRQISAALFQYGQYQSSPAKNGIAGFSLPADYFPVEHITRQLGLPPYTHFSEISLTDVWEEYRTSLIIAGILLLIIAALLITLAYRNRELEASGTALAEERQRLTNIIWGTGVGTWEWNVQTNETIFNERWAEICGYTLEELAPVNLQSWLDLVHPDDLPVSEVALQKHFNGETSDYVAELRMRHKDGHWVWVLDRGRITIRTEDGQPLWMAGTHLEITARKLAELSLRESESRLRILIERFPGGVLVEDGERNVVLTNQDFCDIFSIPVKPEALIGSNCRDSATQLKTIFANPDAFVQRVEDILTQTQPVFDEVIHMADGRILERHYIPVHLDDNMAGHIWIYRDITKRKNQEAHLEHIAYYDALTDLPNRSLLSDRINQAITQADRRKMAIAICYIDLDGFKEVNDTLGHNAGDDLLITVSKRMRDALREGDTISRLGGDEFVAVMIDLQDTESALPLVSRLLSATNIEVENKAQSMRVSASIGLTFYPQEKDIDADHLLRQADHAMYQAKQLGKNRYAIFDPEQDH